MTEIHELDRNSVPDEEIPAHEEDRPDFPDDGEGIIALNLKPTAHVLFTLRFSLRSEGASDAQVHRFLTKIRVRHYSERQFYRIQRILVPWLHQQAKTSCTAALKRVPATDYFGFDGAWNHNRNGSKFIGTLCNISQRSVIEYSMIEKRGRLSKPFEGASELMGAKGFHELLTMIKMRHLFDIVHSAKSFLRCFHVINTENGGILDPFGDRLLSWFRYLVSQNFRLEEKKELWRNVLPHFRGDHSKWRHSLHESTPVIQDDEHLLIEAMRI
jgi:hypothetical protein